MSDILAKKIDKKQQILLCSSNCNKKNLVLFYAKKKRKTILISVYPPQTVEVMRKESVSMVNIPAVANSFNRCKQIFFNSSSSFSEVIPSLI